MATNSEGGTEADEGSSSPEAVEKPQLRFQPAVDDKVRLTAYLKSVAKTYQAQQQDRRTRLALLNQGQSRAMEQGAASSFSGSGGRDNMSLALLPATKEAPEAGLKEPRIAQSLLDSEAKLHIKPSQERSKCKDRKRKSSVQGRSLKNRKRSAVLAPDTFPDEVRKAAIRRAKARTMINIYAPDPEQHAPPGETEDERRRRKERVNGRRKRAKKLIEIEELDSQVMDLNNRNQTLKAENDAFRKRLAEVREMVKNGGTLTVDFLCLRPEGGKKEDTTLPAQETKSEPEATEHKDESPPQITPQAYLSFLNLRRTLSQAGESRRTGGPLEHLSLMQPGYHNHRPGYHNHRRLQGAGLSSFLNMQPEVQSMTPQLTSGAPGFHSYVQQAQLLSSHHIGRPPTQLLSSTLSQLSPQLRSQLLPQVQQPLQHPSFLFQTQPNLQFQQQLLPFEPSLELLHNRLWLSPTTPTGIHLYAINALAGEQQPIQRLAPTRPTVTDINLSAINALCGEQKPIQRLTLHQILQQQQQREQQRRQQQQQHAQQQRKQKQRWW